MVQLGPEKTINLLSDPYFYPRWRGSHFNCVKTAFEKFGSKVESHKKLAEKVKAVTAKDVKAMGDVAHYVKEVREMTKINFDNFPTCNPFCEF